MQQFAPAPTVRPACLDVVSGPAVGQRLSLETDIRFGREETGVGGLCGDPWLSRPHAAVRRGDDGLLQLEDLGSVEGTTLNGVSVRGPRALGPGDVIELGSSRMVVGELGVPPVPRAQPRPRDGTVPSPGAGALPAPDWRRVLAAVTDLSIEAGIAYGALQLFLSVVTERGTNVVYGAIGFLIAAQFSYRFLCESLTGQTFGKRIFGIRVVRVDGRPLDPNAAMVRTLLLLIDGWVLIGLLTLVLTGRRRRQRLGDLAAGTIVVGGSTPHAGFARSDRDRLMLCYPLLWCATIAIVLRLLGPGLQNCHDAGIDPPVANEGSCLEIMNGALTQVTVVDAGHRLSLPSYDLALQRTAVERRGRGSGLIDFKIAVTNTTAQPLTFDTGELTVRLLVPAADGGSVPVREGGTSAKTSHRSFAHRPAVIAPGATVSGWLTFPIPTAVVGSLTAPTSDLVFYTADGDRPHMGEIRLWLASGSRGQAALSGLTH